MSLRTFKRPPVHNQETAAYLVARTLIARGRLIIRALVTVAVTQVERALAAAFFGAALSGPPFSPSAIKGLAVKQRVLSKEGAGLVRVKQLRCRNSCASVALL